MIKKKHGGRTPGAKNKISEAMRQSLSDVLQCEIDGLKERFESLYDIQRLELLVKLLPFVVPKLATEININQDPQPLRFQFDTVDVCERIDGEVVVTSSHKIRPETTTNNQ
jgi:hypothetical protein